MKIIKALTVGILLLICMTKISTAASIIYDFTGANTGTNESLNLTVDGVSVNVTAWANMSAESGSSSWFQVMGQNAGVYDGSSGLGVQMGSNDYNNIDGQSGSADGVDYDEGLLFTFLDPVNLESIDFNYWGIYDDFNLTIDGSDIFLDNHNGGSDIFTASYTGTEFLIWGDGNSDAFRIEELIVAPVPEPATIAILCIGIAGIMGGTARRRMKKSQDS